MLIPLPVEKARQDDGMPEAGNREQFRRTLQNGDKERLQEGHERALEGLIREGVLVLMVLRQQVKTSISEKVRIMKGIENPSMFQGQSIRLTAIRI